MLVLMLRPRGQIGLGLDAQKFGLGFDLEHLASSNITGFNPSLCQKIPH